MQLPRSVCLLPHSLVIYLAYVPTQVQSTLTCLRTDFPGQSPRRKSSLTQSEGGLFRPTLARHTFVTSRRN